jgi:class 3 adenylate cyclase/tetratricopeptide (TPR) repeat protein
MAEQRKVVTVLFADVVGSTQLAAERDPEVVRSLMSRYFNRIGEIAQAYGGTVEKFAGDAAMVVFGVPAVHDDDAERAVRAALEIRDGAAELAVRVGVNTGEAVTAMTGDHQFMVSGDTVNVAARLQQGAEAGEVLVGPLTHQLTRNAIEYEERAPVAAKGKSEPLAAHRAVHPRTAVPEQSRGVPGLHAELVGRNRELRLLLDTYARAAEDRRPHLFTIVGAAGIGKSRLVSEALTGLAGSGARLLRGRCLPYGRGITYWPLVEMLRQDTGISLADERSGAIGKLDRWLGELLSDDPQRPAMRARLAVMLGLETAETTMPDTPADRVEREIGWAVRHYIEAVARNAPLIAVFDDLQWAETPIVSLIEQIAERSADVPVLIICVARPEFLETRTGWSAGKPNSTTITLDPLSPQETSTLVSRLLEIEALPEPLRRQIIERSAGTPLFCEEFIHMLIDEGLVVRQGASWRATATIDRIHVPQGINAVLAARLDLLSEEERSVLQAASVIGERFGLLQVEPLAGNGHVESRLDSLRRKGLVSGGDGAAEEYSFRHLLIRDAAYASLPKSGRAMLHDRFRAVLEREARDPQQVTEILAHHAERAFALSRELGLEPAVVHERAAHAVEWLFAMADRARTRHDTATLETMLRALREAAEAMPEGGGIKTRAQIRMLEAQLLVIKGDYPNARNAAADAAILAQQDDLLSIVATARLTEAWISNWALEEGLDALQKVVDLAIEACRRAGDVQGEIEARHIGANVLWAAGRIDEFVSVNEELIRQAESAGDVAHVATIHARLIAAEDIRGNSAEANRHMAAAEAMAAKHGLRNVALRVLMDKARERVDAGDLAEAERRWREFERVAAEAGAGQFQMSALRFLGDTLLLAGRPGEAATVLDEALRLSHESGERWNRTELFALRARAALDAADVDSADRFIASAMESLRPDDVTAVSEANLVLGAVRTAQQRDLEAEAAFRRALEVVEPTGYFNDAIPAALTLAAFLAERGRTAEADRLVDHYALLSNRRGWYGSELLLRRYREIRRA